MELLDLRVHRLVRRRYTKQLVGWKDLLPAQVDGVAVDKYVVERTMYRPRDVVVFFNCCIEQAIESPEISPKKFRSAEAEYSRLRFRSLADEWYGDYPNLLRFVESLKKKPPSFTVADIGIAELEDQCLGLVADAEAPDGELKRCATKVVAGELDGARMRVRLVKVWYEVGLVGLKTETFGSTSWSFRDRYVMPEAEIADTTRVEIAPIFYRVLGVKPHRKVKG